MQLLTAHHFAPWLYNTDLVFNASVCCSVLCCICFVPCRRVSHMSHVGGLVAGLFTSFMFLPNLKDKRWRAARKFANHIGSIGHSIYDRISHGGGSHSAATHGSTAAHWSLLNRMESCWRRHAWLYRSVWVLSALIILFMFCGLPVYIWLFRIPAMKCAAIVSGGV